MGTVLGKKNYLEFAGPGGLMNRPGVAVAPRDLTPSYMDSTITTHSMLVNFSVPVVIPSIGAGTLAVYTGTTPMPQGTFNSVQLATTDTGQFSVANVVIQNSVAGAIYSHPNVFVIPNTAGQRLPLGNVLTPGATYNTLNIQASVKVYTPAGYAGETIQVTGTLMLHGAVTSDS